MMNEIFDELSDADARTAWVVAATDPKEVKHRYNLWAKYYNADLVDADDYIAPEKSIEYCPQWIPKEAKILDAACGTGLSGKAFFQAGYENITGLDFAADMLEFAKKTPFYRNLIEADLGKVLPYDTHSFDAVIKIGGSPVPPVCMHEFGRITRPGGHIFYCGSVEAWEARGFRIIADNYVTRKIWQALAHSKPFQPLPKSTPDLIYKIIGFQVLR